MQNRISVLDYNADWALKERFVHPRSRAGYLTLKEFVEFYGGLGVDGLDLMHCYWQNCSPAYVKSLAADSGLPIICYVFEVDLVLPPTDRQAALGTAFSLLDRTAELGASLAMIVPAWVKESVPLQEQRSWLVQGLRECARHAQSLGLTLAIENLDDAPGRPLIGRGSQCRKVCAEVDSPAFRLIYDTGATQFVEENPLDALLQMAPYVTYVHVKNNRALKPGEQAERRFDSDSGRGYTGTVLDRGEVNLRPIFAELNRMRYEGYVLIEYQGEDDPRMAMKHNVAYLRQLMDEVH